MSHCCHCVAIRAPQFKLGWSGASRRIVGWKLGGQVEPLPLEWVPVVGPGHSPVPLPAEPVRLYLLNLLDVVPFGVDAVLRQNKETNAVLSVSHYAFRPEDVAGKHLFLPEGRWLGSCLVSEDFKRIVQRQGLHNAAFRQIQWQWEVSEPEASADRPGD